MNVCSVVTNSGLSENARRLDALYKLGICFPSLYPHRREKEPIMAKAKKAKPVARSHHKKPTSARMLKNRPPDPPEPPEQHEQEQPEQAAGEAEELETPSTPKPKPRQARLPGTEDPEIEELESAAEEYADIRDQRMELTKEEVRLQSGLLAAMKKYNKTSYVHDGYDLKLVAEKEKVRVRIKKDE